MPPQESAQRKNPASSAAIQTINMGTKTNSFGNQSNEEPLLAKKSASTGSAAIIENEKGEPMRGLLTIKNTEVKIKLEPDSFIRIDGEWSGFSNPFVTKEVHNPQLQFILPSKPENYVVEKSREIWGAYRQDIYILRDTTNNSIVSGVVSTKCVEDTPKIIGITLKGEEAPLSYAKPKITDTYSSIGPHDNRFVHQSSFQAARPKVDFSGLVVPKMQAEMNQ